MHVSPNRGEDSCFASWKDVPQHNQNTAGQFATSQLSQLSTWSWSEVLVGGLPTWGPSASLCLKGLGAPSPPGKHHLPPFFLPETKFTLRKSEIGSHGKLQHATQKEPHLLILFNTFLG